MFHSKMVDNQYLSRSKSFCSLISDNSYEYKERCFGSFKKYSRTLSDSSLEVLHVVDSDDDEKIRSDDSGMGKPFVEGDPVTLLENKIDILNDMFLEQCDLLTKLKDEVRNSKVAVEKSGFLHKQMITDLLKNILSLRIQGLGTLTEFSSSSRAQMLLDAIEFKKNVSVDREIRDAITNFLGSDELKEHLTQATAESVRSVIEACVSRDVSTVYLPILQRSHRQLTKYITGVVEDAFVELEENLSLLSRSVYRTSRSLRRTLERHQSMLSTVPNNNLLNTLQWSIQEVLHKGLENWRQQILDILSAELQTEAIDTEMEPEAACLVDIAPPSPLQPINPNTSMIDQLMLTAQINKKIDDDDLNGAFELALSAADLSLVMAACRAAERAGAGEGAGISRRYYP